jgi:bacillithiol system protein YtxJ
MAISWTNLTEVNQVDAAFENSHEKSIVFFKHSTRCIVSRHALNQLEKEWNFDADNIDFYLLDLLNHRDVSNYISEITGVYHQSPQIVVLRNKDVVYNASHEGISAMNLHQKIN